MPELVKPEQRMKTLRSFWDENKTKIAAILPRHFSLDRQGQLLFTCVYKNPDLLDCTPASLVGALMQGGMFGLEPVGPGGYWLAPFWQKANPSKNIPARRNVTMIIDYRGLMGMARRTREVKIVDWREVREGDKFDYEYGSAGFIKHRPDEKAIHSKKDDKTEERPITHCYAYGNLASGATVFEVMRIEDIRWHRDRYSKAAGAGPWVTAEGEMGAKTCVRKLADKLPFDPLLSRAVEVDNKTELGVEQDFGALLGELSDDDDRAGGSAGSTKLDRVVAEKKQQDEAKANGKAAEVKTDATPAPATVPATTPAVPASGTGGDGEQHTPEHPAPAQELRSRDTAAAPAPASVPTASLSGLLDVVAQLYTDLKMDGAGDQRKRDFMWGRYVGAGVPVDQADPAKVQTLINELTALRDKRKK